MRLLFNASLFVLPIIALSCSGNPGGGGDNPGGLEITIHSPKDNTKFKKGETIVLSYTVKDDVQITTIAWDTNSQFGTGSLPAAKLLDKPKEYSGEFSIVANAAPGTHQINIAATDEGFNNSLEKSVTVIIE